MGELHQGWNQELPRQLGVSVINRMVGKRAAIDELKYLIEQNHPSTKSIPISSTIVSIQ